MNVSHLRRENELYRVIENFGGIVTLHNKDFFDAHMALIQTMVQAGEATSSPLGTRLDKRTAMSAIDGMVSQGRVKLLKTAVVTPTGVNRPTSIVYLPDIEQVKLNEFLAKLSRGAPPAQPKVIKKIDERVEYGPDHDQRRSSLPLHLLQTEQPGDNPPEKWNKNVARAEELFAYDDTTVREVLLTERTTLGQLYGFVVAKALRARKFHLAVTADLEKRKSSPRIISLDHRIIHLSYFWHEIELSTYSSLVTPLNYDEELTRLLESDGGRDTLLRCLPSHLVTILQIGRSRVKSRFLDMLEMLQFLQLVTPLQVSESHSPSITCVPDGEHPNNFDLIQPESWNPNSPASAPIYWRFNTHAPVYRWAFSESSPPFWKDLSVTSSLDALAYWRDLQDACTDSEGVQVISSSAMDYDIELDGRKNIARSLRRAASWSEEYHLTWHQSQYLKRYVDKSTGDTPLQDATGGETEIQRISWVISAPPDVVVNFFTKARVKMVHELDKARRKALHPPTDQKTKKTAETKALLSKKATEAKMQRERDWDAIFLRAYPEPLKGSAAIRVRQVRTRFLQSSSRWDVSKWEKDIHDAVREAAMAANKILKTSNRTIMPQNASARPLSLITSNPLEKSIEILIAQQGPPLSADERRKSKKKNSSNESTEG